MSSDSTTGAPFAEHRQSIFGGVYRLLSKIDRTRLTAAYWVADEVDDQYLLIEFLNRTTGDHTESRTPESWQSSDGPRLSDFLKIVEQLSRLRHPNIEPVLQFFEDNGTGYAVVQSRIAKSLADEIDRNVFFHQPAEVLTASQDLVEAVAYCTAMRIQDVELSPDAVSIDDDGNPMISIRHLLEDMLEAKAEGQVPDLAYGAAQCIYAMMTGVIPEAQHVRKHMVESGQADPVVRTVDQDLPYPTGVRRSVDIALAGGKLDPAAVLVWTRKFGSDEQSEEPVSVPVKPKRKRGPGIVGVLTGTAALTAAVFAFVEFKDDLMPSSDGDKSTPSVEVSIPQAAQEPETATKTTSTQVEPETSGATELEATTTQADEEIEAPDSQVAAAPEVETPVTPEVPAPSEQPVTDALPVPELPNTETSATSTPQEAESTETPADVADAAPDPIVEAPDDQTPARRPVSAADLEAVLRDLAGGSQTAPADAPEETATSAATGQPIDEAPAPEPTPTAPSQPEPTQEDVVAASPSSDDQTESSIAATAENTEANTSQVEVLDTFSSNVVTGITWRVTDRIAHEVIAEEGGDAFLRLRSLDNHFSFVTKNPWYARNSEIRSFGDQNVNEDFSLQDALNSHFANSEQSSPLVDLLVSYDGGATEAAKIDIPVEAVRSFGPLRVAQRNSGGKWKLVVDQIESSATGLVTGDEILSFAGVEASPGTISQLLSVVEAEKTRGKSGIDFSIRRGGDSVIVVSVGLNDL